MRKKHTVRLTAEERKACDATIGRLRGGSQQAWRARSQCPADADGPDWTDRQVADAFRCRTPPVEDVRRRFALKGFERAFDGKRRASPPVPKLLDRKQEAHFIALRMGPPPKGIGIRSLRLLGDG